jgi:hypothetical protein
MKYNIDLRDDDALRFAWIAWRIGANGAPEFRGAFASEADARADPVVAVPAVGWKLARFDLIGWHALVLKLAKL